MRRTLGWEYVHIAVDDYSRLAYAEVLPDEKATTAAGFLRRAVRFYRRHGIKIEQLLTDNGGAYIAVVHALACRQLGIKHLRTRPYRPQTSGRHSALGHQPPITRTNCSGPTSSARDAGSRSG